jgi:glycosyltransferase involved in cell wall biosynthesis
MRFQLSANTQLFLPEIQLDKSHQLAIRQLAKKNIQLIFFVHDLIPLSKLNTSPREISFAFEKYIDNVRLASKVYVPSEQVKKQLLGYLRNYENQDQHSPQVYVSSPLGLKKTSFTSSCIHLSLKGKRILYVSSFIKRKNQIGVIRNVAKFTKKKRTSSHLVLVGAGGNMVNILRCLASVFQNKYLQIVILKDINDCCLSRIYSKTDVAITLSFAEGFGIPILDALDRNITVISSPIPSAIENEDNENLILVDPSRDSEIQGALNIALNRNNNSVKESQSARVSNWPFL